MHAHCYKDIGINYVKVVASYTVTKDVLSLLNLMNKYSNSLKRLICDYCMCSIPFNKLHAWLCIFTCDGKLSSALAIVMKTVTYKQLITYNL